MTPSAALRERVEIPAMVRPDRPGQSLRAWIEQHRADLEPFLLEHGAALLRGFDVAEIASFEWFVRDLFGPLMEYCDRATPRSRVEGQVFTATDYPPTHEILLHNESAYASRWPGIIALHCVCPSEEGGETPIADVRRVRERIDPAIRGRFAKHGVLYVRNFGRAPFGLPWQTVFQTDRPRELERFGRENGIEIEWLGPNRLRTRQVRPALARHPKTGEVSWMNHAALLNESSLPPALRETYHKVFREEDLPNNTYYGDGTRIEPEVLDEIRSAYRAEERPVAWQAGDVLVLDNILAAHGRRRYRGTRNVVVAMARQTAWTDVAAGQP